MIPRVRSSISAEPTEGAPVYELNGKANADANANFPTPCSLETGGLLRLPHPSAFGAHLPRPLRSRVRKRGLALVFVLAGPLLDSCEGQPCDPDEGEGGGLGDGDPLDMFG